MGWEALPGGNKCQKGDMIYQWVELARFLLSSGVMPELIALIPADGEGPPSPVFYYGDAPGKAVAARVTCAACHLFPVAKTGDTCQDCPTLARRAVAKERMAELNERNKARREQKKADSVAAFK